MRARALRGAAMRGPRSILTGVRPRISGVVAGCVLATGLVFYLTFLSFAHDWLSRQLDDRGRSLARFLARRGESPITLGGVSDLSREAGRTTLEADVAAVQFLRADGSVAAERIKDRSIWKHAPTVGTPRKTGIPERVIAPGEDHVQLRVYAAPILRDAGRADAGESDAR